MQRLPVLIALLASASGCGSAGDPPPYPSDGNDREQITAVVEIFNYAAAERDAFVLCDDVLAPSASGPATQACADRIQPEMDDAPENLENPITDVTDISIKGNTATAQGTQAEGEISLTFEHEDGRWRMVVFD